MLASTQNAVSDLVSGTNNIVLSTQVIDTTPIDIPHTVTQVKNFIAQGWKGLKLKMREGLDSGGRFYTLVSLPSWRGYWCC